MPTGTLCVSKISANFETYCATFVPYDATLPSSVTLHGVDRLQSLLEEAGGSTRSDRTRALSDAMTLGVAILTDVNMTAETLRARVA
jgi:hypothetical protein